VTADRVARKLATVADARRLAQRRLPRPVFDYLDGAAGGERTAARNREALEQATFRPRFGDTIPVVPRVLERTVFGAPLRAPLVLGPVGFTRSMHVDGDIAGARAARTRGLAFCHSSMSGHTMDAVASATGEAPYWFQLYPLGGRQGGEQLIDRATRVGASALVVTFDTAVPGNRERDLAYGNALPIRINRSTMVRMAPYVLPRPRWLWDAARDRFQFPLANASGLLRDGVPLREEESLLWWIVEPPTWADLAWIRAQWPGQLIVKGLLTAEDARKAVDHGADGIVVSNHGGRQLDQTAASLHALTEIVAAVGQQIEVAMDGGIRRGSDIAVALCHGARSVWLGRAWAYGLAAAGEAGVNTVVQVLLADLARTMQLLGVVSVDQLTPDLLA
jgi:isopentenyl diphosphate isomerase/L-lactate dehydrogenase-like FMN-dependent dehydrogenase